MNDIKLRTVDRSTIKTLDRVESSMHHMKDIAIRTKSDESASERNSESEGSYATDNVQRIVVDSAAYAGIAAADIMQTAYSKQAEKSIRHKQESIRMTDAEVSQVNEIRAHGESVREFAELESVNSIGQSVSQKAKNRQKAPENADIIQQRQRKYSIKKLTEKREAGDQSICSFIKARGRSGSRQRATDYISRTLRGMIERAQLPVLTVGVGSIASVIIVTIFVFFGVGAITFSNNSPETRVTADEEELVYFIPDLEGSPIRYAIVKAAAREIGNVGGRKFWSWYGFKSHVYWCACFTSYIAYECGCIQSGICPRSALVDDWVSFYKKQHRWARGDYTPHSGDFIIFDWECDGQPDHIGIVESCDGKTVHTIEGNSSDRCMRNTYRRGSSVIYGYGVPNFSGH